MVRGIAQCLIFLSTLCVNAINDNDLRDGDLLFIADSSGDFTKAIVDATSQADSLKYSHVAMLAKENGDYYVIEATSGKGVVRTEWSDYINSLNSIDVTPTIVVKRVSIDFPVNDAVARANAHLGEPYDWNFLPDNGKMYCSELIYDCYRTIDGAPLFTSSPMNFRDASGEIPSFWTKLFENLGEPIPEGVMGTNPSDLAKSPILVEVCRLP